MYFDRCHPSDMFVGEKSHPTDTLALPEHSTTTVYDTANPNLGEFIASIAMTPFGLSPLLMSQISMSTYIYKCCTLGA